MSKKSKDARADQDPGTTLAPVHIEDWTLFAGAGDVWVNDLDLAERADLGQARDIRPTIFGLVMDGGASVIGPAADAVLAEIKAFSSAGAARATKSSRKQASRDDATAGPSGPTAFVRAEFEVIPKGNRGGTQRVIVYRLNEEAALLTITRLRTKRAIALTRAIVRVFLAAARGEFGVGPSVYDLHRQLGEARARADLDRQQIALLQAKLELVDPTSTGLCGVPRSKMIKGLLGQAARCAALAGGDPAPEGVARRLKTLDNELRQHVGFVHAKKQGWESLELLAYGKAMQRALSILAREEQGADRVRAELEARVEQFGLPGVPDVPKKPGRRRPVQAGGVH